MSLLNEALQPKYNSGLVSVLVVLAMHLLVLLYVMLVFLCTTRLSLLGETWYTIGQLLDGVDRRILGISGEGPYNDKEVEIWAEKNGIVNERMRLGKVGNTGGRVGFLKKIN
jgi:hypothetical protein